ncbi:hypothetical protein JK182_14005 [Acetobacter okinawensis]|uniref:hypothetical protein n=1 Tax=Acetobacter okinawensis TaxID=1076594 RepID=UPI001BA6549E|nr:hypothetical protein [Acetobacter okinawensis]MBS0989758.1 hypothetical protein [Acetobacter okinawensis]
MTDKQTTGNDFSRLHVGMVVAFSHPETITVKRDKAYELFQRGENHHTGHHWFMLEGETEFASESVGANEWGRNGGYIVGQR